MMISRDSNICRMRKHPIQCGRGFSLLEILIAMAVLTFGLLGLLGLLQRAMMASEPIEFDTRAALIAQSMLAGLQADPAALPFIQGLNPPSWPLIESTPYGSSQTALTTSQGTPFVLTPTSQALSGAGGMMLPMVFSVPGNSVDDDRFAGTNPGLLASSSANGPFVDVMTFTNDSPPHPKSDGMDDIMQELLYSNGLDPRFNPSKRDFDGGIEEDVSLYAIYGSAGQLFLTGSTVIPDGTDETASANPNDRDFLNDDTGDSLVFFDPTFWARFGMLPDGDFNYDPQRGIDEEIADGLDNDGDGLVDEDIRLASQLRLFFGLGAASHLPANSEMDFRLNPYAYYPLGPGNRTDDDGDSGDFKDLNGNGEPDYGEPGVNLSGRVFANGLDDNGDGRIDEQIDEEIFDGIDNDNDGLIDEDCHAARMPWNPFPLPAPNEDFSFQIEVSRVSIGGNGIDDDGDMRTSPRGNPAYDYNWDGRLDGIDELAIDEEFANMLDDDRDGRIDEDTRSAPATGQLLVRVIIILGDDRQDNDGDGWIDEEKMDGLDNDGDGLVDEDVYRREYQATALVNVSDR